MARYRNEAWTDHLSTELYCTPCRKAGERVHSQEEEEQPEVGAPGGHGPARGHHDLRGLLPRDPRLQPAAPHQAHAGTCE